MLYPLLYVKIEHQTPYLIYFVDHFQSIRLRLEKTLLQLLQLAVDLLYDGICLEIAAVIPAVRFSGPCNFLLDKPEELFDTLLIPFHVFFLHTSLEAGPVLIDSIHEFVQSFTYFLLLHLLQMGSEAGPGTAA